MAEWRTAAPPPITHDRLGRPLIGPCLIWTGRLPKDGYARIKNRAFGTDAPQLAHRVAYALANAIPLADLRSVPELDHLCRTPACSAVAHLEPVARKENLRRGDGNQNVGKTECARGHRFTEENTLVRAGGARRCRTCHRDDSRERWRAKNRPDLVGLPPLPGGRNRGKIQHGHQ
jgi:hypothetical protein